MYEKVTSVYFSPTGNTKNSVEAMIEAVVKTQVEVMDINKDVINLTVMNDDETIHREFAKNELVIFGMPVYGGRIPCVAKNRLTGLKGNQTPCVVVVTYGNRHYDDALLELSDVVKEQGFVPVGAAALVGRHTYGQIQVDRPNAKDLQEDQNFIQSVLEQTELKEIVIPGNRPYREGGNGGKFRPLTTDACTACGICVKECPVQAIGTDCKTIQDSCIACFRCIRNCPVGAKNIDVPSYNEFAVGFTEKLKNRRENEYYL